MKFAQRSDASSIAALLALKARRPVATAGAQRNPWDANSKNHSSPEGAKATRWVQYPLPLQGEISLKISPSTGFAALHPWLPASGPSDLEPPGRFSFPARFALLHPLETGDNHPFPMHREASAALHRASFNGPGRSGDETGDPSARRPCCSRDRSGGRCWPIGKWHRR